MGNFGVQEDRDIEGQMRVDYAEGHVTQSLSTLLCMLHG